MGIRKNAKFLTPTERENFVKACVLMKADIVNPTNSAAAQYSRWDEYVAIHNMIQVGLAPPGASVSVNFGHGGLGSYSFLSWHRYFLYRFELQLQSYVPGVMLPYWDWTNPSSLLADTFLGPTGAGGGQVVPRGYFAPEKPGTGANTTPAPPWWPASLDGWNLHSDFGIAAGGLTRDVGGFDGLPTAADLRTALGQSSYRSFQRQLEGGRDEFGTFVPSGSQMHNGLHGYIGGHMGDPAISSFDPIFYLHHCNIDRLWAMWQLDGHATEYPSAGAKAEHGPTDAMYPWVGTLPGYGNAASFANIVMPDTSAIGIVRNVDTLNFRAQFGYTYDTLAVIGIGLDRTGSMSGLTPEPMTGSGTVTKWEAAKRGVSMFLHDAETVQQSGAIYVTAGVKTFRSMPANDFTSVFPGTPYGLIKPGTVYSQSTFDGAVASMTPGGGTPLADALQDVEDTLVEPPEGWTPADEPRYLAMLTDGMLTSGSPLASIPDGSFAGTAIFAMGFGTPADVDYPTLAALVAKGRTLGFSQVFHGESAGTIDKFYSNALARAIGFSTIFDPVIELFAGEHTHLEFWATSAEDTFLITAQGMDFTDPNWSFHLQAPDGTFVYADGAGHDHAGSRLAARRGSDGGHSGHTGHGPGGCGCQCMPDVTARRSNGRLTVVMQRDGIDASCWVGRWRLMIGYKDRDMTAMAMFLPGALMLPVAAGPVHGPRRARILERRKAAASSRAMFRAPNNRLDSAPTGTNSDSGDACAMVVNIYARTNLRIELAPERELALRNESVKLRIETDALTGGVARTRTFGRLVSPAVDIADLVDKMDTEAIPRRARRRPMGEGKSDRRVDSGVLLGLLERENPGLGAVIDEEIVVERHEGGPEHFHVEDRRAAGPYHLGVFVEGAYCPGHDEPAGGHSHGSGEAHDHHDHDHDPNPKKIVDGHDDSCPLETFTRILGASVATFEPEGGAGRRS
jgi:Common central domain of tyrosinase